MILASGRPCAGHRDALLGWVDRREAGPGTAAALDHLDRCGACRAELADVAVAIVALRRIGGELVAAEPSPDAWLRLRARIGRRDPWPWRASLGGLLTSAMLVGAVVMPATLGGPAGAPHAVELPAAIRELRQEARYVASAMTGDLPPGPRGHGGVDGVPRVLPEEIAEIREEVTSAKPIHRPPEPI